MYVLDLQLKIAYEDESVVNFFTLALSHYNATLPANVEGKEE